MTPLRQPRSKRYGSSHHLSIETAADLETVLELDEAHWVATNAPMSTMNCDATFLKLVDTDNNGRIMCHEVTEAIEWLLAVLADRAGVTEGSTSLPLAAINIDTPDGRRILGATRKILVSLGRQDTEVIGLEQIRQVKAQVEAASVSAAGVVLPEAAKDPQIGRFIADVVAVTGGAPHPAGCRGVDSAHLDRFLGEAASWLDWQQRGQIPADNGKTEIMPLGLATPAAYQALTAVRGKIDQYFAQCEAAALDERFVQRMGWTEAELGDLDFDDPAAIELVLAKAPLAKAKPTRQLPFDDSINPFYAEPVRRFRREIVEPVLGQALSTLSAGQWNGIKEVFAHHHDWVNAKPATTVETLGEATVRGYLHERFADAVRTLIAESAETSFVLDNVCLAEKLLLYQAFMMKLANNFVSFPHLYDPHSRAMFETGSLVMDGRRFNLAVKADNHARHATVAKNSNMFLLYVQVVPPHGPDTFEVALPVTAGSKGNLYVGKRGVFRNLAGNECDAIVTYVVDNPISIREAMMSPFQRLWRLLTGKIEAITSSAGKKLDAKATGAMDRIAPPSGAAPAAQQKQAMAGGMLMGAGVAVAALGSSLAYAAKTVAEAGPWPIVISVLAAVLLVMLPTAILAFLKLRGRDLSAILEGSGWAINARMRLTRRQRRFFTQRPIPIGGARGLARTWWRALLVVVVLGAIAGGAYLLLRSRRQPGQPPSRPAATRPATGG